MKSVISPLVQIERKELKKLCTQVKETVATEIRFAERNQLTVLLIFGMQEGQCIPLEDAGTTGRCSFQGYNCEANC